MLGDTDHALADYSESIRLEPLSPEAYLLRGKVCESMGDKERAKSDFAMARQLTELWPASRQEAPADTKDGLPETVFPCLGAPSLDNRNDGQADPAAAAE